MATTKITSIQKGIIFLMAAWSGQAKWAYTQLTSFLEQRGMVLEHFICIDIDRELDVCDLPELSGKIHGFGEAAVVKDGRITFVTALGKDKDLIDQKCEELLRFYKA